MQKNYLFAIVFIALSLVAIFFTGLRGNQFILTGDEYISLSREASLNSFLVQQPDDFGTAYSTIIIVTFFDRAFYLLGYLAGLSIHHIQQLLYFVKIVLILSISYLGFRKISAFLHNRQDALVLFLVAIWYSFNSFALVYWHGTAFSLTALISYALAPLAFFYFVKSLLPGSRWTDKASCALAVFFMSFTVYFLAVFALILSIFTTLYLFLHLSKVLHILKSLLILFVFYTPFLVLNFFFLFDMFFNPISSVNMSGGETYGMLQGGFLYPLFMWFSWGIYTVWHPRNIYTFYEYFYTIPSIIAPFLLYGLVLYKIQINRTKYFYVILLLTLLILLFIVKAAQPPFGGIYLFLIDHVSIFRVFRSPDSKIGFGIVFLIAVLLTYNYRNIRRDIFILLISIVILIQSYLIYSGIAIKGQNTKFSTDRVMHITDEYAGIIRELNESPSYGYVLPDPPLEYSQYNLGEGEVHLGQDLLPKSIGLPISYVSPSGGMTAETYTKLTRVLETGDVASLNMFPIHYYLVRKDILQSTPNSSFVARLQKSWKVRYESPLFTLYESPHRLPILSSPNLTFEMINPVQYRIKITNLQDTQKLTFYQSYNKYWELYPQKLISQPCENPYIYSRLSVIECRDGNQESRFGQLFISEKPLFSSSHAIANGYANQWKISKKEIIDTVDKSLFSVNTDGSVNIELLLYFKIQSLFYTACIVSFIYALILSGVLFSQNYAYKRSH